MTQLNNLFGLIGYPIEHSKSPALHNEAFQILHMNSVYELYPIRPENFNRDFPDLLSSSVKGLNVTMPYKKSVIPYLDTLDPISLLTQSVNTITKKGVNFHGTSTDGIGFFRSLFHKKPTIQLDHITILGCGGAARSILATAILNHLPIKNIHVFQRKGPHFEECCNFIHELQVYDSNPIQIQIYSWTEDKQLKDSLAKSSLCINCTSIGLMNEESPIRDINFLHSDLHVYDIIYKEHDTALIQQAKAKGCSCQTGIGMLLFQGAESFYHFTGQPMPIEELTGIQLNEI